MYLYQGSDAVWRKVLELPADRWHSHQFVKLSYTVCLSVSSQLLVSLRCTEDVVRCILRRVPIVADSGPSDRGQYGEASSDGGGDGDRTEGRLSVSESGDELSIVDVRRDDASTYSCRAYNSVGAATKTYTLVVHGTYIAYFPSSTAQRLFRASFGGEGGGGFPPN